MNEDAVSGRVGAIVEAEQTIKVLSSELLKFKDIAKKWNVELIATLTQEDDSGQYSIEIAAKTGEHGARLTMTPNDIAHYAADPETAARNICDVLLTRVLGDVMREHAPTIVKAINNAVNISRSSL